MNCRRIRKRLAAYQDGEMGGEERNRISAHLEGCPACRSAYAELGQVWRAFERIPEIQASQGFEQRLFAKIHAASEPCSWWRFPGVFQWLPAPAMALILVLMGATLGGFLGNALMSGFASAPPPVQVSKADVDIVSFRAFAAVPPGTLGDGYLRMASFTEDRRK